ncbi:putative anion transporter 6 [Monoraphidium neglectum]|uniref:Putative anion transporter 6 n=1 Tax=Monoraphidium neglectum TaxID=145388 RepID=A0A0D2KBA0_9CHLO|nr:putative anion transporter 6 [Monoraphidium neglectum]KIY93228.1 putative anion transporter 6 [Monoraphidium neglectum]|eukprot:XP_013892248.1 putative anion transporter 6 [Monoraphidium neglectum]
MVLAATMAFVLSNMGKVDMSVAMVPLAEEAGWGPSTQGLVQGIFYVGYCLACIPGGYLASLTGGRTVLPLALGLWSAATVAVPLAAATVPTMALSRFTIGAGQGTGPSAVVDIVGRTTPPEKRSNATSSAFGGLHLGTVVGLLVAPAIVDSLGWRALFYIYGGLVSA